MSALRAARRRPINVLGTPSMGGFAPANGFPAQRLRSCFSASFVTVGATLRATGGWYKSSLTRRLAEVVDVGHAVRQHNWCQACSDHWCGALVYHAGRGWGLLYVLARFKKPLGCQKPTRKKWQMRPFVSRTSWGGPRVSSGVPGAGLRGVVRQNAKNDFSSDPSALAGVPAAPETYPDLT